MARIYFDNAATSWPKPEPVYTSVEHAMRHLGTAVGRGSYQLSLDISRQVETVRDELAKLIQAPSRRNISFCYSCTDALNTAILGLLNPGDHVVSSMVEHNSVLRPLKHLEISRSITVTQVACDLAGRFQAADVLASITPETRLVVLTQASNVTGAIQELAEIGQFCRRRDIPFLVDAAQTIGHCPADVQALNCDLLAAAGHKGLLGPLGTGFLYSTDAMGERMQPLRFGGTGTTQLSDELPVQMPEKFEAGNLNLPGLIGLGAALQFLQSAECRELTAASESRNEKLLRGLQQLSGVKLYGPQVTEQRLPVYAIEIANFNSHDAALILDANWSIQVRSGYHCAPRLHQALGTERCGGLVRISPGLFSSDAEIETLMHALEVLGQQQGNIN